MAKHNSVIWIGGLGILLAVAVADAQGIKST